jgi:hypothetical protein
MDSKELRSLMEAYQEVHAPQEVEELEQVDEADSLAAMAARRAKRMAAQRKREGTTAAGNDFGHDYSLTPAQQKARRDAEFKAGIGTKKEEVEVDEAMSSYDRNRKRAAQRAAARNAARDAGKTGAVPGVGYVTPRRERETYVDSSGTTRHKSGARMEEVENVEEGLRDKVGEKVKKHINKYAYKQGIHNNPGWLRKPEKRAALNKAVRDDIKKNPKAAVQYAAGEVKRKVKEKLRREEFDVFDTILEFLIDEEIAQDIQEANWIMANAITEEQIDEILGMFKKKPEKKTEYAGRSMEPVKKDPGYTVDKRRPEVSVTIYGKGGKTDKFKSRGPVR